MLLRVVKRVFQRVNVSLCVLLSFKNYSHCMLVLFLLKSMKKLSGISPHLQQVLKSLSDLFVLFGIAENSGSFMEVKVLFSDVQFYNLNWFWTELKRKCLFDCIYRLEFYMVITFKPYVSK